jgi:hypothetical protein
MARDITELFMPFLVGTPVSLPEKGEPEFEENTPSLNIVDPGDVVLNPSHPLR